MKKLLLTALLAVSATAFGAITTTVVTGTETGALPVVVKGNVIEATKLTMELTALDNAGVDGRSMTFNFGDLVKGISDDTLVGTFQVRLLKVKNGKTEEVAFAGAPQYTLLKGTESPNSTFTVNTTNNVKLDYVLQGTQGTAGITKNTERLAVTASAKSAEVGQFTDSSIKIQVTLQESGNTDKN